MAMASASDAAALRWLPLARRRKAARSRWLEARISWRASIRNEGHDFRAGNLLSSSQRGQLDQECEGFHRGAEALEQACRRARRAAGGEYVVDNQNALTLGNCVGVNLERVSSVFERVLFGKPLVGQLSRLAHRDESGSDRIGNRRCKDISARLDSNDMVDSTPLKALDK